MDYIAVNTRKENGKRRRFIVVNGDLINGVVTVRAIAGVSSRYAAQTLVKQAKLPFAENFALYHDEDSGEVMSRHLDPDGMSRPIWKWIEELVD